MMSARPAIKVLISLLIIVFSLIGIADAGYLTYEKLSGYTPPCHPVFKCGEVLASPWANIGPVPISVFGIFFYSTFLILGLLLFFEFEHLKLGFISMRLPTAVGLLGLFGGLFSIYLVLIMGVILQAWCFYCVISAINCVILLSLSSVIYFKWPALGGSL